MRRLPVRVAHVLYFTQHLIITGLMSVMLVGGYQVIASSSGRSAILKVPLSLISLSLVLCVLFIAVVSLWRMWVSLCIIRKPGQGS